MYIDLVSHDFTEFTCQIAVARTSSAVLIEVVRAGILVFFLNLQERLSAFYHGVWCQHVAAVVQAFSRVWLFATPCTTKRQASVSFTISQSLLKLMSIELMMPSQPLLPTPPPALSLSQDQGLFQQLGSLHQVAKVLELQLQHQCFQLTLRVDFL